MCGNSLNLIKSHLNCIQRVKLDNNFDFANIICGVLQDSVLWPLKYGTPSFHLVLIACKWPTESVR